MSKMDQNICGVRGDFEGQGQKDREQFSRQTEKNSEACLN